MKKILQFIKSLFLNYASAAFLLITLYSLLNTGICSAQFGEIAALQTNCSNGTLLVPDFMCQNLSTDKVVLNYHYWNAEDSPTLISSDTLHLNDTTYFDDLGIIVMDPTDSAASTMHAYRVFKTHPAPETDRAIYAELYFMYDGDVVAATGGMFRTAACNSCILRYIYNDIFQGLNYDLASNFPGGGYGGAYSTLTSHGKAALAQVFNLYFGNSFTVSDYLSILNPDSIGNMASTSYCGTTSEANSCGCQAEVFSLLDTIQEQLKTISTEEELNTLQHSVFGNEVVYGNCAEQVARVSPSADGLGYETTSFSVNAGSSVYCSKLVNFGGETYKAFASATNWTYPDFGISFDTITKAFSYINGFSKFTGTNPAIAAIATTGSKDSLVCGGDTIQLGVSPTAGRTYHWSPSIGLSNANIANPKATYSKTEFNSPPFEGGAGGGFNSRGADYVLTVTDSVGCVNRDSVSLRRNVAVAGPDHVIGYGDTCRIGVVVTDNNIYQWNTQRGLSDSTIANPLCFALDSTEYVLTMEDTVGGCGMSWDTVMVNVVKPGQACWNPIDLGSGDTTLNDVVMDSGVYERWFKIKANSTSRSFTIKMPIDSIIAYNFMLTAFSDCNPDSVIYSDTLFSLETDSMLRSLIFNSQNDKDYYFRLKRSNAENEFIFPEIVSLGNIWGMEWAGNGIISAGSCVNSNDFGWGQDKNCGVMITLCKNTLFTLEQKGSLEENIYSSNVITINNWGNNPLVSWTCPGNQLIGGGDGASNTESGSWMGTLPFNLYFTSTGTYTVTLSLYNYGGAEFLSSVAIQINVIETPVASLSVTTTPPFCTDDLITVSAGVTNASTPLTSSVIDWGDGNTSIPAFGISTHGYDYPGIYTITYTATNQCGTNSKTTTVDICYKCADIADALIENQTVTSSSSAGISNGGTYAIDGTLTINDTRSYVGCTFIFAPGAKLLVKSNKTLTLRACVLKGCTKQWRGVWLENNAKLTMLGSRIQDAAYGIKVANNNQVSVTSGYSGITFSHCLYGIYAPAQSASLPSTINLTAPVVFDGGGGTGLKPPYPGQNSVSTLDYRTANAAMYLVYHPGITLNGQTPTNTITFKNSVFGIRAYGSNVTVKGCKFISIGKYATQIPANSAYNPNGSAIFAEGYGKIDVTGFMGAYSSTVQFDACQYGIMSQSSNSCKVYRSIMTGVGYAGVFVRTLPTQITSIQSNTISSNLYGIKSILSENPQSLFIGANTINVHWSASEYCVIPAGIYLENLNTANNTTLSGNTINMSKSKYGIYMNNADNAIVYENTITMPTTTSIGGSCPNAPTGENNRKYGMYVTGTNNASIHDNHLFGSSLTYPQKAYYQSLGSNNAVKCNDSQGSQNGFEFFGGNPTTDFKSNTLNNHTAGLYINSSSYIGLQDQKGNLWPYNSTGSLVEARNDNGTGYPLSKFKVHDNNPTNNYWPQQQKGFVGGSVIDISSFGWFQQASGTPGTCSTGGPPKSLDASEDSVFRGHLLDSVYDSPIRWAATEALLRRIQMDPVLLDSVAGLDTFYTAKMAESVGLFMDIKDSIAFMYEWEDANDIIAYSDSADTLLGLLSYNDSLLTDSTLDSLTVDSLLAISKSYLEQIAQIDSLKQIKVEHSQESANKYSGSIKYRNSTVSVSSPHETNSKTVNDIYMRTVAIANDTLKGDDISDLEDIIWQCPLDGGHAVYQARALYHLVNDSLIFNDSLICSSGFSLRKEAPKAIQKSHQNQNVHMFPNPTERSVNFHFDLEMENDAILTICDISGRQIDRVTLAKGTIDKQIVLENCKPGMYFVIINSGKERLFNDKLIIKQ